MNDAEMIRCPEDDRQLERLRAITHRLRAPEGCPWDAEQTHESLVSNLIEETYETVDAIRSGDMAHLKEELGDLLLQVFFHSEMAGEKDLFRLEDVARNICDKLIRRHPHVFGDTSVGGTEGVLRQWDEIKRAEKGDGEMPYLHRTGHGLPAMLRAAKLQKKASKAGFDWTSQDGVIDKIREELVEMETAVAAMDDTATSEELGDLLFSVVNLIRFRKQDPEELLNATNVKFENRFGQMETILRANGLTLSDATPDQMEEAWEQAKKG
jgi:MazG family protein